MLDKAGGEADEGVYGLDAAFVAVAVKRCYALSESAHPRLSLDDSMIDPLAYWTRVMSAWGSVGTTHERLNETATASQAVIASRTTTIGEAMRSPLSGDYAELGRMVPEKVAAFSQSGTAGLSALFALQAGYAAQAQEVGAMLLRGRPLTLGEMAELSERTSMHALQALEASAKMGRDVVAPLHKAATGNAKRLRKTR